MPFMRSVASLYSSPVVSLPACVMPSDRTSTFRSFIKEKKNFVIHLLLFVLIIHPFKTIAQHQLTIQFQNKVGEKYLQLDSTYTNAFNESLTVRNFKYYISNIVLKDGDKTQ